jgi:hypothetical protein
MQAVLAHVAAAESAPRDGELLGPQLQLPRAFHKQGLVAGDMVEDSEQKITPRR